MPPPFCASIRSNSLSSECHQGAILDPQGTSGRVSGYGLMPIGVPRLMLVAKLKVGVRFQQGRLHLTVLVEASAMQQSRGGQELPNLPDVLR